MSAKAWSTTVVVVAAVVVAAVVATAVVSIMVGVLEGGEELTAEEFKAGAAAAVFAVSAVGEGVATTLAAAAVVAVAVRIGLLFGGGGVLAAVVFAAASGTAVSTLRLAVVVLLRRGCFVGDWLLPSVSSLLDFLLLLDVLFDEEDEFDFLLGGDTFVSYLELRFRTRLVPGANTSSPLPDDHHLSIPDIMFVPYSASSAAEDNYAVDGFVFHVVATSLHEPSHMNRGNNSNAAPNYSGGISTFCVESYCNEFKSVLSASAEVWLGSSSWLALAGQSVKLEVDDAFCPFWIL